MNIPIKQTEFYNALKNVIDTADILTESADCWPYGYDYSRIHALPQAVVFAHSHNDVLAIVRLCNQYSVSVVARGRGTGTPGGAVPLHGGIVLSLEKMDQILAIDSANRAMRVEPGVINDHVQQALQAHGFFWAPDPSSSAFCSIGGNLAYNSAGPRAVKYGTPRENTLGLHAVTGAGEEIRTGVYTSKSAVGYDLTRLLIGSEGTLAIITEATLKLTPLATAKSLLRAIYTNIDYAALAVSAIMAQPIVPCALEFIDGACLALIKHNAALGLPNAAGALLMIEVDGTPTMMDEAIAAIKKAAANAGLLEIVGTSDAKQAQALWQARKNLSQTLRQMAPKKISEDVVVPVSNLAALVLEIEQMGKHYNIPIANFGHAGNGNIHVNFLIDPADPVQAKNAAICLEQLFDLTIKLNGAISGEHGIGLEKKAFLHKQFDATTLNLMRKIKAQFDPNNILNPDKIFA